ncbi:glycosyltransferase family 2 protein [Methylophaga sp.]|uniref:glycosyltransferase family 2 protein n=1 Tax=Methylophaga sp. TaxID=2024840 RepID=UPI003A935FE5
MSYLLVSPCRNESAYMRITLDSVVNQTVQPDLWVIVDDGSTDQTPNILAEYAERYPFIKIITRENRGHRSVGPGVIEAFYHGYDQVDVSQFDYVCKFDLDLDLPPKYFEILIGRMQQNPRIGTCSGKAYFRDKKTGELISEKCGDEMSVGMTKFYRRTCFEAIGGFVRQVMWDGIDCHKCRQMGWIAVSWDEPDLRFIHLRPMGSSQQGIFTGRMRHGFGQYFMGTGLTYMTASSVFRMLHPPYVLGGAAMWWGYVKSMLQRKPRFEDKALVKFINNYQWQCLLKGKSKATAELNVQQAKVWEQQYA